METETYVQVVGYPNYEISNLGNARVTKNNKQIKLKSSIQKTTGYYRVAMRNEEGTQKQLSIHRLIALHFIPNAEPDKYNLVDHKDGNRINNKIENLRWCNEEQSMRNRGK